MKYNFLFQSPFRPNLNLFKKVLICFFRFVFNIIVSWNRAMSECTSTKQTKKMVILHFRKVVKGIENKISH